MFDDLGVSGAIPGGVGAPRIVTDAPESAESESVEPRLPPGATGRTSDHSEPYVAKHDRHTIPALSAKDLRENPPPRYKCPP